MPYIMALPVMEFQVQGCKISRKKDPKNEFQKISKNPIKPFTIRQTFFESYIPELETPQAVLPNLIYV